ncbi:MAG: FMN-binding negative transcriptional regulator [Proteobacteria bacterium]|nr:FMN-binding negative transcriptional regulator [Pseudomonadota bacterium]
MYIPEAFREERQDVLEAFIRRHPLAALICTTADGLTANHIPMLLAERRLRGHVARANSLWKSLGPDAPVLVIFGGANHYMSPSWYPAKQEHGKVVPTWNYSVVHAHGTIRFSEVQSQKLAIVTDLTDSQEGTRQQPWRVTDAPEKYIEGALSRIVAFEINVTRLIGKFKASQHRDSDERQSVRAALDAEGYAAADRDEVIREGQ